MRPPFFPPPLHRYHAERALRVRCRHLQLEYHLFIVPDLLPTGRDPRPPVAKCIQLSLDIGLGAHLALQVLGHRELSRLVLRRVVQTAKAVEDLPKGRGEREREREKEEEEKAGNSRHRALEKEK